MLSSCEKCNESCSPVNEAEITDWAIVGFFRALLHGII
jgi:hypothetical protein